MDSPGTEVPLLSDDGRQVPQELQPLHNYYEHWNQESWRTWSNLVRENVIEIWGSTQNRSIDIYIHETRDRRPRLMNLKMGLRIQSWSSNFIRMTMDYINAAAHPIKKYFQDPIFTELDKAYLGYHGYEVLQGDSGIDMIDSTTLMLNMKCSFNDKHWSTMLRTLPAVYAGLSLEVIIENWIAKFKRKVKSQIHTKDVSGEFDRARMEDYMNTTNTHCFLISERMRNPNLPEDDESYRQSVVTLPPADHWAFCNFDIRILKAVHKDHQSS